MTILESWYATIHETVTITAPAWFLLVIVFMWSVSTAMTLVQIFIERQRRS